MHPLPSLTTNRLLLRPLQVSDAEALYKVITHSRGVFAQWFIWAEASTLASVTENLQQAEDAMALGAAWHYALCDLHTEIVLGRIGFSEIDPIQMKAELGYWVRTDYERKGVMTEALRALLGYAVGVGALRRVVAYADVDNVASQRVLEKLGFQNEGLRPAMISHPVRGWRDHYAFALPIPTP